MRALLENPLWQKARRERKYQRFFGIISGILLSAALLALFDGLIAQMRQGSNELDLLPGQSVAVSGPAVLKNPIASDLVARFAPPEAPLRFELEGFFTGYWFGNGMWRGQIVAADYAEPGRYALAISFKGASATTAQKYGLRIFADEAAMRAADFSWLRSHLNINPFLLAACTGGTGIFAGMATYFFGRRFGRLLGQLGIAEVYSVDRHAATIWCLAPRELVPRAGLVRMILDADGHIFGEARTLGWEKGRLQLKVLDEREAPTGALVCLRHPESRERDLQTL